MLGDQALDRLKAYPFETIVDVGCGAGRQAARLRDAGRLVYTIDARCPADYTGDYTATINRPWAPAAAIWCCHVLEHQRNPGRFLECLFQDLADGGLLAITVPPLKTQLVGGHVSLWTEGLLLYHLVLAGFDCAAARVGVYDYNISVLVEKRRAVLPPLRRGRGDLESLAGFFPCPVGQGLPMAIGNINW